MQPSEGTDDDVPLIVQPNSAGREGSLPELVKCRSFKGEVSHIVERAQQFGERGIP